MPKIYKRYCDYCGQYYEGQGRSYCSMSCRMKEQNRRANPAKSPEARAKISDARKGKPTTLGLPCPPEKRAKISIALTGRTLTPEHKAAISRGVRRAGCTPPRNPHLVGPNHPNWIDGQSTIRQTQSRNPEYIAFRNSVLKRDGWTCQDCGQHGGRLQAHHIKPWGPYPELRYKISNGLTLCIRCHKKRHRNQPRPVTVGPRTLADLYQSNHTP